MVEGPTFGGVEKTVSTSETLNALRRGNKSAKTKNILKKWQANN
jgi:hypothetical protein